MMGLRGERGLVLLWVLAVVALLASLLTEFAFSTLVDLRLTETFRDSSRAYYLAKGGVSAGRIVLQQDDNKFDAPTEMWAQQMAAMPVGEGFLSVSIEDLGGRLDLNRMVNQSTGNPDPVYMDRFIRLAIELGAPQPDDLAAALIDWLDEDDNLYRQGGIFGAESRHYLSLAEPYNAKNGPLDTLEELSLVRGFDRQTVDLFRPHVTVHGSAQLNVNTATAEVLLAWPDSQVDFTVVEGMIQRRRSNPFEKIEDLKPDFQDWYDNVAPITSLATVKSDTYRIRSRAEVNDGVQGVEAVVKKAGDELLYWKVTREL